MSRVIAVLSGALLLVAGAILALPVTTTSASAQCVACNKGTPDKVETRVVNRQQTRVVNRTRVVPRTRVVDHNRLILHKTIVRNNLHTIVRNHTRYEDTIVHRMNTGHRYATENQSRNSTSVQNTSSHVTRVRYVQGTNCNCGGGERYVGRGSAWSGNSSSWGRRSSSRYQEQQDEE
jgi:hypothetical protein